MEPPDRPPSGRRSPSDETHDPAARRRPAPTDAAIGGEEALRRSLTDLAHELSGLLDGSLRFVTLARRSLGAEPSATEASRQLERAGAGLAKMAGLISRAMAPGVGPRLIAAADDEPLVDAVRLAVDMARPIAAEKRVEVRLDIDPALVLAAAGPAYTVLSNALRNAIEATEGEGRIEVRAAAVDRAGVRCAELLVIDDGPGPIDGAGDRVFDYGYTTKPGGLGVGLAMLRQIAGEVGGEISLTRNPPTVDGWRPQRPGARFLFRWPVRNLSRSAA